MKILLLGVGLQGKAALHHLVNSSAVTKVIAADVNHNDLITYVDSLKTDKVIPIELDVRDNVQVAKQMQLVQAAIILLPQQFRLGMAKLAIENNIHFIETSYKMPEYAELDKLAREKNIAILPECGLDPGIDLVLAGRAVREFDEVHELHAYGTGVPEPEVASNPLKYKISWTFAGVLKCISTPCPPPKKRTGDRPHSQRNVRSGQYPHGRCGRAWSHGSLLQRRCGQIPGGFTN